MPRLYLNLHNSHVDADDPEGADYADLCAAREAALQGIRSLLSEEVKTGTLNLHGHLDIVDDGGVLLESISFAQAVSITSP